MKTAILCVYFGSSDTVSMDLLEAELAEAFPDCTICRAFLSRHIAGAPSMEQALAALQDHDRILIQPMLVSRGPTYDKLLTIAGTHPVSAPLLDSPQACAEALAHRLPDPLVLMAHGSAQTDLSAFSKTLPSSVLLATMEGTPTLDDLLPAVAGKPVHLAPFLLTAGTHGTRDLAQWRAQLEAVGCTVTVHTAPLAHLPQIRRIFVRHLMERKDALSCIRD